MQSVLAWEVPAQLGHKSQVFSKTEIYARFDPAYLSNATKAIDDYLGQAAKALRKDTVSESPLPEASTY